MSIPDVVVVGGGPIGLAAAWRAQQAGSSVVVCDPNPGGGAADVAAGMLAAVTEAWFGEAALTALSVDSAARWPSFAAEVEAASGMPVGFDAGGTLLVAHSADDLAIVERVAALQRDLGLDAERTTSRELRRLEPALSPRVRGGVVTGDQRVDPRALCAALATLVDVRRAAVTSVSADAVTLDGGEVVPAGAVVVAAGVWSAGLGLGLPVRPVKGEVVTLRVPHGAPPLLGRTVRGVVDGATAYLVPRPDGRIVIGATAEERGFDTTVTAGGVYQLLRDATALVPGIDELELVEVRAGLRPATPDAAPLIGWLDDPRVIVATGHYRNGILLTPVTADAVAALLTGTPAPDVVKACDPGRFGCG